MSVFDVLVVAKLAVPQSDGSIATGVERVLMEKRSVIATDEIAAAFRAGRDAGEIKIPEQQTDLLSIAKVIVSKKA